MLSRFTFYITYAARNLRRSLRWTIFAIFCIASGVAAVVALRSLGLAIGDSLIENARASNKGDISITQDAPAFGGFDGDSNVDLFTPQQVEAVGGYAEENGGTLTTYSTLSNMQITELDGTTAGRPQFVSGFLIDPATFPPTGDILASDPAGVALRDLLTGDRDVAISQNLADQQNLAVGAQVRASGTTELFTVRGIVPTETEASFTNLFASFFGFAYFPQSAAEILGASPQPNAMAITLPSGTDLGQARSDLYRLGVNGSSITTLDDVIERNQVIADVLGRFIVVMGLGALLIGGVGTINTMLVLVGRRTNEIAAMKTFGLKGGQISLLFLSEAFLLGLMGSILGCILGSLLSFAVNRYGETFLNQRLAFAVYPEALLFGIVLGMVVSMVFGVLPVMIANKVRPAAVLRPNENQLPHAGCVQTIGMLLLVVLVIGGVAGQILGSIPVGIIGVAVTLLLLGLLVGLMWVVVWLVSKLPSFGSVDLRLALRNLSARRLRTATTMLALAAGMFALSSITFVGVGTREVLQFQLVNQLGGNVLVFPVIGAAFDDLAQGLLNTQLNGIEGIMARTRISTYTAQLAAIDGLEPTVSFPFSDQLPSRAQRGLTGVAIQTRETVGEGITPTLAAGRALNAEDAGSRVLVISQAAADAQVIRTTANGTETVEPYTIGVGSVLTIHFGDQRVDFTVVGIEQATTSLLSGVGSGAYYAPPGSVPERSGSRSFSFNVLNVQPDRLNDVLLALSALPFTLSLDITFIDGLISRLITQFSAIPTVVGLLSLLAAAVTMANTVSLAVLERRRSIGVLKAIGLKSRRVLWVMLLENTIVGVLGGVLGIGLSALGVSIITSLGQGVAVPIPRDAVPVAVALMIAAVAIAWIATFLSARPAANERVANVLRYE